MHVNNNDDESNVNHNKYIVNVSYSDIAFQCCRRDCFTVLRTNNMIRLVNRKIKKQWYMRKNETGGGGDPKGEKKHLRSDRSAWETTFKKHLNHPFTVMQPFVLQHTCTRTQTHKKKKKQWEKLWKLLLPHCWWQVGQIKLKTLWTR